MSLPRWITLRTKSSGSTISTVRSGRRASSWNSSAVRRQASADYGALTESQRIYRAVDMANQDGDIDGLEGSNSKSPEHMRHVTREA